MNRLIRALAAPSWLVMLAAIVWVLSVLDSGRLALPAPGSARVWLSSTDPVVVAFALLRATSFLAATYLFVCTALSFVAHFFDVNFLRAAARAVTVPAVRRINARVLQLSLAGVLAMPAVASASPVQADVPVLRNLKPAPVAHPGVVASPAVAPTSRTWTISGGENLWVVAESVLRERNSQEASGTELTRYWQELVELNKPTLARPDNPDLVFPGQVILLP